MNRSGAFGDAPGSCSVYGVEPCEVAQLPSQPTSLAGDHEILRCDEMTCIHSTLANTTAGFDLCHPREISRTLSFGLHGVMLSSNYEHAIGR